MDVGPMYQAELVDGGVEVAQFMQEVHLAPDAVLKVACPRHE
jgi:hypothetical protein